MRFTKVSGLVVALILISTALMSIGWVDAPRPIDATVDSLDDDEIDASTYINAMPGAQFIENLGQARDDGGLLYLQGSGMFVSFHVGRAHVVLTVNDARGGSTLCLYDVCFVGASPVAPVGADPSGTTHSFFLGNDPSRWVAGARGFTEVLYQGLWDGIDLVYRLEGGRLKYDIIVAPGGDPASIRFSFRGAEPVSIDPRSGDLVLMTTAGSVRDERPTSFQESDGVRTEVDSAFVLLTAATVGFDIGCYDPSIPLVIDPRLVFSTFLGSSSDDRVEACFIDGAGNLFLLGTTASSGFPTTTGAYDNSSNGGYDVFVSKLAMNGSKLLYSTFIGGSGNDNSPYGSSPYPYAGYGGIWVDDSGAVYVTGHTMSSDFPTTSGAYDTSFSSGYDGFALKLSTTGDSLVYSTYLGSTSNDHPIDLCVNSDGNAIVSGYTWGSFPTTTGAYDTSFNGGCDAFVTMLSANGSGLVYSTFVGGSGTDCGYAVDVGPDDLVYVAGYTEGSGFPTTTGAYDTSFNSYLDMYVLKLNKTWASLVYSTYVGSSSNDYAFDLAVDDDGRANVVGMTESTYFPMVSGAYDSSHNGYSDTVVFRLNATGASLECSTFFGTSRYDYAYGLDIAANGDIVVAGFTSRSTPTTSDAYDSTNNGDYDVYVARFNSTLGSLKYGSMFGSSSEDKAWDVKVSPTRNITYVVGHTTYSDFPTTTGTYDTSFNSGSADGFVLQIADPLAPRWGRLPLMMAVEDVPFVYNFSANITEGDSPLSALSLVSSSSFVKKVSGMDVTFTFPNGVTSASVRVNVSDQFSWSSAVVNFTVMPVNDPPCSNSSVDLFMVEEVPKTFDLSPQVWDVDNPIEDLRLILDSPYLTAHDLEITAAFPEGITSNEVWANVTDGALSAPILLRFIIYPVDDPPSIQALPTFNATEDVLSVFDLTPYISDVDTPVYQLRVIATGDNCTVVGQQLHFMFPSPVPDHYVTVEVSDICSAVTGRLLVHVVPSNDPPRVSNIPTMVFREDSPMDVDLEPYLSDEDTPSSSLALECEHATCVGVSGLHLTFLYVTPVPDHRVQFKVRDGDEVTAGSFLAHVEPANDPPSLAGLDDLLPPYVVSMPEDIVRWIGIRAQDEDSQTFRYSMEPGWSGATVYQNASMRFVATSADIGEHLVHLVIDDMDGGTCRVELRVVVTNVNDPPSISAIGGRAAPFIITLDEDTEVWAEVAVSDEDSTMFRHWLEPAWSAAEILTNGTIHIIVTAGDIGERSIVVGVDDLAGGTDSASVLVIVKGVNDIPRISDIGGIQAPFRILVDERTVTWWTIHASDEESAALLYTLESVWEGITIFQNGTLRIVAGPEDLGEHRCVLLVDDRDGGLTDTELFVSVRDVNDPPGQIFVLSPANMTVVEHGTNLTFSVDVRDPDEPRGQIITVTWRSNMSGELMSLRSGSGFTFITDALPPGSHHITVTAFDGELSSTAYIDLTVLPEPKHQGDGTEWSIASSPMLLSMVLVLIVLLIVTAGLLAVGRRRDRESPSGAAPCEEEPIILEAGAGSTGKRTLSSDERERLRKLDRNLGLAITQLEGQRTVTPAVTPVEAEPAWIEDTTDGSTYPGQTADERASAEVKEIMKTLTQLPNGLPATLSAWDLTELARAAVVGEKRTSEDGRSIVSITGRWYYADRKDLGTFMREARAPPTPSPVAQHKRVQQAPVAPRRSADLTELPDSGHQTVPGQARRGKGVR